MQFYLTGIYISTAGGQGQQRAIESWLAPDTPKVTPNEGVSLDHEPCHDTTMNSSRSPKVEPAEAVLPEIPALEPSKLLPAASAQAHSHLQAGIVDFFIHLWTDFYSNSVRKYTGSHTYLSHVAYVCQGFGVPTSCDFLYESAIWRSVVAFVLVFHAFPKSL